MASYARDRFLCPAYIAMLRVWKFKRKVYEDVACFSSLIFSSALQMELDLIWASQPAVSPVTKATSNEESFVLRQGRLGCCCWMFALPIVCVTLFINIDQGRIQTWVASMIFAPAAASSLLLLHYLHTVDKVMSFKQRLRIILFEITRLVVGSFRGWMTIWRAISEVNSQVAVVMPFYTRILQTGLYLAVKS